MTSFNVNHPEKREGEVFLTNADDESFLKVGWRSKRRGIGAYDVTGNAVSSLFPVFVSREELKQNGIDPNALW